MTPFASVSAGARESRECVDTGRAPAILAIAGVLCVGVSSERRCMDAV